MNQNVLGLLNSSGNKVNDYEYSTFGELTDVNETVANRFRFASGEQDRLGLYYFRARYYRPELMRFLSEDPIGLAGGINQYAYAGNDPVDHWDPTGLKCDYYSVNGETVHYDVETNSHCVDIEGLDVTVYRVAQGAPPLVLPASAFAAIRRGVALARGARIVWQARHILSARQLAVLRAAANASTYAEVQIGSRTIGYEPTLPGSAFTWFSENTFTLGPQAFASEAELAKTVLQELYRLSTTSILSTGLSAPMGAAETDCRLRFRGEGLRYRALLWDLSLMIETAGHLP